MRVFSVFESLRFFNRFGYFTCFRFLKLVSKEPKDAIHPNTQKIQNTQNIFSTKNRQFRKIGTLGIVNLDHLQGPKRRFLEFFKDILEMFKNCSGIVFCLMWPSCVCIFNVEGWCKTFKIIMLGQNIAS